MKTQNFDFEGLSFDDVLLRPQKSVLKTRVDADLTTSFLGRELRVPFLSAPMPSVTGPMLAIHLNRHGGLPVLHRFCSISEQFDEYYQMKTYGINPAVSIGIHDGIERTHPFLGAGANIFVLDVAHAHSDPVIQFVKNWKQAMGGYDVKLVVGNIATTEAAWDLYAAGADALKVGIGPGSVCTTRQVTGFGVPQLQAIRDVKVRLGSWTPIIADGGIRNSGDIVKALAAGADVVMIGSLFAHAEEAPNHGTHYGCASSRLGERSAPEGIDMGIISKEPLADIVNRLAGGLRSGISYGGGTNIAELRAKADWIKLTDAGRKESKL